MSAERSSKRRKIDSALHETVEPRSSPLHTRAGASKPAIQGKRTTDTQDAGLKGAAVVTKVTTPGLLRSRKLAGIPKPLEIEDSQDGGSESAGEEIVVRSSGRVRRLPAKLKENEHILASRGGNDRSKSKKQTTTAGGLNEEPVHDTPMRDVSEPIRSPAPSTAKRKRNTKTGKENITPPVLRASSEYSRPDDAHSVGLAESQQYEMQQQPRSRNDFDQIPETIEANQTEAVDTSETGRTITSEALENIRDELFARATGRQAIPQIDRQEEYAKVASLVRQAVEAGESNSMLLIGARGTGKTALLNQVIRAQQATHPDDFHVVRLNGFIHTDDKLALRDIWRQLGREMALEDKDTDVRSYADTLSMLLALLSRPQELDQSTSPDQVNKSVIFILDEFDLFATHPRQTLLYNLFDIAQSRKAPIAVLGLTTRIDVVEALEKRVKSRFSHRYVHLAPAKSLAAFTKICKATLSVTSDTGDATTWNATMESLFATEPFSLHVRKLYYRSKSIPDFLTTMLMPIGLMGHATVSVGDTIEHFLSTTSMSSLAPDSKLELLSSLSTLQLALLICAARQNAIYATDNVTFNLAYEEYKAIAGKAKLQATASGALGAVSRVWSKDVARNAWADIINIGLIMEDGRGIGKVDIALEEIVCAGVELGQWSRWCKEI